MNIAGVLYKTVLLAPGTPDPEGMDEHDEGWCDYETGTIYVRCSVNPSRQHATLVHEIVHAALEGSGAQWLLGQICEKAGRDVNEVEETLVRMLAPALTEVVRVYS